jgi:hypothetical protein
MAIETRQSKGGRARAERLDPAERKRIAAVGGRARAETMAALPKVEYSGVLNLGGVPIPCAVLDDGRRVLTEHGITQAVLGTRSGGSKRIKRASRDSGTPLPLFIAPERLKPFIDKELVAGPLQPIQYQDGRRIVTGYDPRILRAVCEVWLRARQAGALQQQQLDKAQRAEALIRALADVGLIALVDEATGYQRARARDELQKILAAYIAPELLPWAKRFPDTFYEELHRVRGWRYEPGSHARTAYIGKLTNSLIYEQLPPGVLDELKAKNPVNPATKKRRHTHHQLLTPEIGHSHLEKQIVSVTTLLRVSDNWSEFSRHFSKAFPPGPGDLFALPPPESDK